VKKNIYAESYGNEPKDNSKVLEAIQTHKMDLDRIRKLGNLLKEEKSRNQELQRRINRLEEDKTRLAAVVAKSHR